jgi:hypothetical protein
MGMPFLRHLPFFSSTFAKFDGQVSDTYAFFEKNILERIERRKEAADFDMIEGEERKDLLNCFLDQMERMKAEGEEETEFKLAYYLEFNSSFFQSTKFALSLLRFIFGWSRDNLHNIEFPCPLFTFGPKGTVKNAKGIR